MLANYYHTLKKLNPFLFALIVSAGLFLIYFLLTFFTKNTITTSYWFYALGLFLLLFMSFLFLRRPYYGVLITIILLPFHAFFVTYFNYLLRLNGTQIFLLSSWKEFILIILILVMIRKIVILKNFPFQVIWLDVVISTFFILGLISAIFTPNKNVAIWGLRYDFEFFLFYFVVRSLNMREHQFRNLIYALFGTSFIIFIFAILQAYVLPWNYLFKFGYSYAFGWDPGIALQTTQKIVTNTGDIIRVISTFSGAIQLASYAMMIGIIGLCYAVYHEKLWLRISAIIIFLLATLTLFLTYTRSAWIGYLIGVIIILLFKIKEKSTKIVTLVIIAIIILASFSLAKIYMPDYFEKIVYHQASSNEHITSMKDGVNIILHHPLGLGIGQAGPASLRSSKPIISESWYLQIGEELGWLGLILFMVIIISLIIKLANIFKKTNKSIIKENSLALLASFCAISVAALFLHTWADTVTAFIFWMLAAAIIQLNIEEKEGTANK